MSVSIIIPAYNSSEFLPAAIESILSQTCSEIEIEIVVIDDGSTDTTKAVCDRYPAVKYIYQSHQGLPSARTKGIDISQGSYLIFLDSNDCLLPETVEIGINCLKERPEVGFVFGKYVFKAINPDRADRRQELFEPPPVASYTTILAAQHHVRCATAICRRVAIESVGGFALDREDLHLLLRIARELPIYFHDRVVCEDRDCGGNTSSKSAKMLVQTLETLNDKLVDWQSADYSRRAGVSSCGVAVENLATLPPNLTATRQSTTQNPDVVFMFSGQGSQYVNMGSNLYRSEPVFQQTIDHCAEILQPLLDLDIRQLIYPAMDAGADRLAANTDLPSHPRYTQPALFTLEYALAQLWQRSAQSIEQLQIMARQLELLGANPTTVSVARSTVPIAPIAPTVTGGDRLVAELQDYCQLVEAQIKIEHLSSWFDLTCPPTEPFRTRMSLFNFI